jgi:hypothetical protein
MKINSAKLLRIVTLIQALVTVSIITVYFISRPLTPGNNPDAYNRIDITLLIFLIPFVLLSVIGFVLSITQGIVSIKRKRLNAHLLVFAAINMILWAALFAIPHIFPPAYQGV